MSKNSKPSLTPLTDILATVQKQFGTESIRLLDGDAERSIDAVSSGCLALDRALGIGGYARGRIVEIFGPESSGKTTLTLHAIAEAQQAGGLAAFVDAEHAFDPVYARASGVRTGELLLSQPDSGEQALDIVENLANSRQLSLIVIDSVAALVPQAEIDGSMGDNHLGLQARLMSRALRKLAVVLTIDDGKTVVRRSPFIVVGNGSYTLSGLALGRREHISDGQLSLYVAPSTGRLGALWLPIRALAGTLERHEQFETFCASTINAVFAHRAMTAAIDGEVAELTSPLEIAIRRKVLRVITPA